MMCIKVTAGWEGKRMGETFDFDGNTQKKKALSNK